MRPLIPGEVLDPSPPRRRVRPPAPLPHQHRPDPRRAARPYALWAGWAVLVFALALLAGTR